MMTEQERVRAAQMLRTAQEQLLTPEYRERIKFFSTDTFNRFQGYMTAGFTEAQAMQLIIHGVKP